MRNQIADQPAEATQATATARVLESRDQRIAAAVLGGLALLFFELRFEHREVLGETWRSWIPLVYTGVAFLAGGAALVRWDAGGRRVLAVLFGIGIAVGLIGFWFHTGGHVLTGLRDVLAAWRIPLGQDGGIKIGSKPPALAPLAFCGLGTLGVLVCTAPSAKRAAQCSGRTARAQPGGTETASPSIAAANRS